MSVYIKGMEMPESCYECPCNKDDGFGFFTCGVTKSECDFISLPPNCPLVPVPPHGRLIDADALDDILADQSEDAYNRTHAPKSWERALSVMRDYLEDTPTIIHADQKEKQT